MSPDTSGMRWQPASFFPFLPFNFHLGHCFRAKGCSRLHPALPCRAAAPGNSPGPHNHQRSLCKRPWCGCSDPAPPSHPQTSFRTTKTFFFFSSACTHSSHKLARGIRRLNVAHRLCFATQLEMHRMALKSGRYSGT